MFTIVAFGFTVGNAGRYDGGLRSCGMVLSAESCTRDRRLHTRSDAQGMALPRPGLVTEHADWSLGPMLEQSLWVRGFVQVAEREGFWVGVGGSFRFV